MKSVTDTQRLRIAYTPDSDDAFTFYAWQYGLVTLEAPGFQPQFHRDHIIALNRAAAEQAFDVVAVSSVVYPSLADRYWILSVGNSVGRAFGPALVSKNYSTIPELRGKRTAVGGIPTTGSMLALMFCPETEFVEMAYDQIAAAIQRDEVDAGVMIHEELLAFAEIGLRCVCDLGIAWNQDTGLPLPVGLNLIRKDLGRELARRVADACQRSLLWGIENEDEAFAFASRFGRGLARKHVQMFRYQDMLCLPQDVHQALLVLFDRVAAMGIGPMIKSFEVIDGYSSSQSLTP
jgi:1,4-dihydroxy-6-naphthoate synthase